MSDPSDPITEVIKAGRDIAVETAKAQQETAKAASKGMDLARDATKHFGVAADEFAAMLGDQMRFFRFKNFNRILKKVSDLHKNGEIHPEALKQLSFGTAIQVLESSSLEEEDDVQDLWAGLIANAMEIEKGVTAKKVYLDLLKQFSSAEVALLNLLYRCESGIANLRMATVKIFDEEMNSLADKKWRIIDITDQKVAIQNLIRNRCIVFRPRPLDISHILKPIEDSSPRGYSGYGVDPRKFESFVKSTLELIEFAAGTKEFTENRSIQLQMGMRISLGGPNLNIPEMNHMLTSLGLSLMRACDPKRPKLAPPPPA